MGTQTANHYSSMIDEAGFVLAGKFDTAATPDTTASVFQKGCQMTKTDAANNIKAVYENVGTLLVPSWNLMGDVTAGEITLAQGSVLVGNASGVAVALAAGTNGSIPIGNGTTVISQTSRSFGIGTMRVARAKYDFAVDGGAISVITLATNVTIPDNAIIWGGILNSTTAFIGAGATISFGTTAGSSANSIKNVEAVATFALDALIATIPVQTVGSAFKMTAAGQITMQIVGFVLTAGVCEVTLFYQEAAA